MFIKRSLTSIKQTVLRTISPKFINPLPKYYSSLVISKTILPQFGIINPNILGLVNLREMILKSKSQN
jgi:hypothetical protein